MTKIIQMYSYKGGAGRTVSTVNLASILSVDHKKTVVCIDMDMEGAGLGVVLGVHNKLVSEVGRKCVQDVFGPEKVMSHVDFEENWWPRIHFDIFKTLGISVQGGSFLAVPAAFAEQRTVDWSDKVEKDFTHFLRNITHLVKPDFIFLDSASGLADWACLAMDCSQEIVVFFRWNKQSIEGTIKVVNFITKSDLPTDRILLVPSAVPNITENSSRYRTILEDSRTRLLIETGADKEERLVLFDGVREAVGLKWEERLLNICSDLAPDELDTLTDLRKLAHLLLT